MASYNLSTIEKERQVLELRRSGATFDEIAKVVGYKTAASAFRACERAMKRTLREAGAEEVRDRELDRLDRLQRGVWGRAVQGDIPAVNAVLRIMERRSRMLGLDAPVTAQVTVEHLDAANIDAEVARLAALLQSGKPVQLDSPIIDAEVVDAD